MAVLLLFLFYVRAFRLSHVFKTLSIACDFLSFSFLVAVFLLLFCAALFLLFVLRCFCFCAALFLLFLLHYFCFFCCIIFAFSVALFLLFLLHCFGFFCCIIFAFFICLLRSVAFFWLFLLHYFCIFSFFDSCSVFVMN